MHDSSLKRRWTDGDGLEVGRAIMTRLTPTQRAAKARDVMEVCTRGREDIPPAVRRVISVGELEAQWPEAREAFHEVRALTLLTREGTSAILLLLLAECVAKTIYNGSHSPGPFDDDAAWYVASLAQDIARADGDDELEEEIFTMLTWGVSDWRDQ